MAMVTQLQVPFEKWKTEKRQLNVKFTEIQCRTIRSMVSHPRS